MKPKSESQIEKYLVKRVKAAGGEVRKVKWIGRNSAPDRVVMLPVWSEPSVRIGKRGLAEQTAWVELKAEGLARTFPSNAHERAQHREHERMRKMGQRVVVIDSYAAIDNLVGA